MRNFRKTASVGLFLLGLCFLLIPAAAALDVSAESAVLLDRDSGRVLFAKNADIRRPIASTTKIMTALVVLQTAKPDDEVVIDASSTLMEGSSLYLQAGARVTVRELLVGLMLRSGNDAAHALALHCAGSVEKFAVLMNQKARELGLTNTHFANPHGLDNEAHYSTARDMAVLGAYAMRNPAFASIVSQKSAGAVGQTILNHNKLLRLYDGANGIKTGFTKVAGRCLVGAAERGGQTLICVTLKAPDDWDDHMRLFDYGFAEYPQRTLMQGDCVLAELPVLGGELPTVSVRLKEPVTAALREEEWGQVTSRIELPRHAWAKVRAGERAGRVLFTLNGHEIASGDLVWDATVAQQEETSLWKDFKKFLRLQGSAPDEKPKNESKQAG